MFLLKLLENTKVFDLKLTQHQQEFMQCCSSYVYLLTQANFLAFGTQ